MTIFTCDIDWAPEEVIADTLALFEKYNVKCTLFATHKSEVVLKANKDLFEVGIHPNFNFILKGDKVNHDNVDKVLENLISIFPKAKGARSHSMTQGTVILDKFAEYKLRYDVNIFLPYHPDIKPFKLWNGLIRVPYNWEDDVHWKYGYRFSSTRLKLNESLNILDFHPIHIYLNTENSDRYDNVKKFYQDPAKLKKYKNVSKEPGTRDLLIKLLKKMKKEKIKTATISEFLNIQNK